ncbi:MAG: exopolyphosphatase [Micrococcales bacterium 73-15]|nr:MAG: exopolyphosphatase [Micrococcales bacterium 73-15]
MSVGRNRLLVVTRVAAIDCGTNTVRLLIADVLPGVGTTTEVVRTGTVTRLGQGVDRTGRLDPEALGRTLDALREFAELIAAHDVQRTRFVATSATRDAENAGEFAGAVEEILGIRPEVVTGAEEAELSFAGAVSVASGEHPGPYLVVDLGGGSTELVLGEREPVAAISLDVGSVRLHERHLHSDPPTQAEIDAAAADVREALDRAAGAVPLGETATLIGVAGTVTTLTAHAQRLPSYVRERIDGAVLPTGIVLAAAQDVLHLTRAERGELPYLQPGRVDVIGAGALVWFEVVSRVLAEVEAAGGELASVVTSEHDILDGIALSLR